MAAAGLQLVILQTRTRTKLRERALRVSRTYYMEFSL